MFKFELRIFYNFCLLYSLHEHKLLILKFNNSLVLDTVNKNTQVKDKRYLHTFSKYTYSSLHSIS